MTGASRKHLGPIRPSGRAARVWSDAVPAPSVSACAGCCGYLPASGHTPPLRPWIAAAVTGGNRYRPRLLRKRPRQWRGVVVRGGNARTPAPRWGPDTLAWRSVARSIPGCSSAMRCCSVSASPRLRPGWRTWPGRLAAERFAGGLRRGDHRPVRVGPVGSGPGISRLVQVHSRDLVTREGSAVLTLRVETARAAAVDVAPLWTRHHADPAGEQVGPWLELAGAYRPPLGAVGAGLDGATLHRAATATTRTFMNRVAGAMAHPAGAAERAGNGRGCAIMATPATEDAIARALPRRGDLLTRLSQRSLPPWTRQHFPRRLAEARA